MSTLLWMEGERTATGPLSVDIKSVDVAKHINLWRKPGYKLLLCRHNKKERGLSNGTNIIAIDINYTSEQGRRGWDVKMEQVQTSFIVIVSS